MKKMSIFEYMEDRSRYEQLNSDERFVVDTENDWPILTDKYVDNGSASDEFFIYPIWTARKIRQNSNGIHYDVCSPIDTMIANLLGFRGDLVLITNTWVPINFERQFSSKIRSNIDILNELNKIESGSVDSLSSCNFLDKIGLGRYGEQIDADAWLKLLHEFKRILAPKGRLYLVTKVSEVEKIVFNRFRTFHYNTILEELAPLSLVEMSIGDGKSYRKCIWRDEHQQIVKDENTLRWIEKAATIAMFESQSERMV